MAGQSGAFDAPHAKMPSPPRGSSTNVTDSSMPFSALKHHSEARPIISPRAAYPTPTSTPGSSFSNSIHATSPQAIPPTRTGFNSGDIRGQHSLSTPPLTPESSFSGLIPEHSDFLTTLFPRSGPGAQTYAKTVKISSGGMDDASWEGVVLDLPNEPKTFYVNGKGAEHVLLRESVVALLDLADEHLGCSALVIALDKSSPALGELLHSLMYVGGTVVSKPPFKLDSGFVLVGIEI
jgi:hypothetical protein